MMSGTQRAAVLLLSLGENNAASVLQHMDVHEVQELGKAMTSLGKVSRDQAGAVLDTFADNVRGQTAIGVGATEYVKTVLETSLGEDKASNMLGRILRDSDSTTGLETLRWMDARDISEAMAREHPQIIAIALSQLDRDQAAEVLDRLPEEIQPEVIARVARLDEVPEAALAELDAVMQTRFAESGGLSSAANVGGCRVAAEILNSMSGGRDSAILEVIGKDDSGLSAEIEDQMVTFESLMELDDRGIQALLKETSGDVLVVALKGAEPAMQDRIFGNMSKRAGEMLRSDLEVKGPVKLSEVEEAQKDIVNTARRLAEEGSLALGGSDDYV